MNPTHYESISVTLANAVVDVTPIYLNKGYLFQNKVYYLDKIYLFRENKVFQIYSVQKHSSRGVM